MRGSRRGFLIAAGGGMVWGLAGYAVLWGHTTVVVSRSFVVSAVGTILLLPVRAVLWVIHSLERVAGSPFEFSDNNWWIGLASGATGAAMVAGLTLVVWAALRLARRSGRKSVAEAPEGV